MNSFYWYDYETFGISPKVDRIAQFAGIRTDENLDILDEQMFYCKPTHDVLPSPEACAITGISPQLCDQKGIIEHEFIKKINNEFSAPGTCTVGYNSISFDDEFTRHTLYRNFIDPYAWHWKNGNTRWDILDVVRLCYALKKDNSLSWAYNENNKPVFKLDRLSVANGIEHSDAHDALADVRATIGIAKIIKETQPKLFDFAFSLRDKKTVESKINMFEPMLHISGVYPAERSCAKLVSALAYHPKYRDRAIVFALDQDPSILLELETEELRTLIFTSQSKLPKGVTKLQIKDLTFNRSPMFVPNIYKLNENTSSQLQIDMHKCISNLEFIRKNQNEISEVIKDIYTIEDTKAPTEDVDQSIYDGFIDNSDRKICDQIQKLDTKKLSNFHPQFKDQKLSKLLLNFKARNYSESLSEKEHDEWFEIVQGRIQEGKYGYLSLDEFYKKLEKVRNKNPEKKALWKQLESYAESFL